VIVCAHLGRPGGRPDLEYSLAPVAARLGGLVGQEVDFPGDIVGRQARAAIAALRPGGVVMLENLRFDAAETSKDDMARGYFADRFAAPADLYVAVGFRRYAPQARQCLRCAAAPDPAWLATWSGPRWPRCGG
jgi:phosphoglycerate kinase